MGYNTDFEGELKFTRELTIDELRTVAEILQEDDAEKLAAATGYSPQAGDGYSWINLVLTPDFTGIKWNGGEKTYYMETSLNIVLHAIRQGIPDLSLSGSFLAQGEDIGDLYGIEIKDGRAVLVEVKKPPMMKCPHCREWFKTADAESRDGD
jgi:hypothetical protein